MHCAHGQCVEQYGTGALVEAVAGRTGASTIVGIDPSQPFIAYARQRFPDPRFSFDCGDGMALPYPDTSFDCALSLLVFQFIPQPIRAANEMRRVTHPGGTVGACVWDSGGGGLEMARIFWDEAVKLDGTAANEIPERSLHCNRAGELTKVWRAAGWKVSRSRRWRFRPISATSTTIGCHIRAA